MARTLAQDKEFCYIYLLRKYFKGDATALARTFALTRGKIAEYEERWKDEVSDTIRAEREKNATIGPKAPSIRSLKDRILVRISETIDAETDPSKLANTYARLTDFQQAEDDGGKSATSIADAVQQSLKKRKR